ncbi:MAG: hypothetical protein AB7T27_12310 [Kiritimatiellia bacterium]
MKKTIIAVVLLVLAVVVVLLYRYCPCRKPAEAVPAVEIEKAEPAIEQPQPAETSVDVVPAEPEPEPVPMSIAGFRPGMTLNEACDLINSKFADVFPPPVVAFDECADQTVLEGTLRIPFRFRHPFVKGQEPWKSFPVQPVKIDTMDPLRCLKEENLTLRKGMQRHILTFDKCFVANGKLYTEHYKPVHAADGTRLDNDNAGAHFQAGPDGVITNIYFSQDISDKLLSTKDLTSEEFALKLTADFQIPALATENRWNQSGERVDAWTFTDKNGVKLVILPNKEVLLESATGK